MIKLIRKILLKRISIFGLKCFLLVDIISLTIVAIFCVLGYVCYKPISSDIPILFHTDTLHVSYKDILINNSNLISTLQEREVSDRNSVTSQDDGIRATRSIFVGLMGILLVLIFNKKKRHTDHIYILILGLILTFFFLDIHLDDLKYRSALNQHTNSIALDTILEHSTIDTSWFYLDYGIRNSKIDSLGEFSIRFSRKIHSVFELPPKIDRIIFYLLPLILVYLVLTKKNREKENKYLNYYI